MASNMYKKFEVFMQERGLSPYKVAKEAQVSQPTLSDWKRGKSEPKRATLEKICQAYGLPLSYFYNDNQNIVLEESGKKENTLTEKDSRDIKKKLLSIVTDIRENNDRPLYYEDEVLDEDDINYLSNAIEYAMNMIKPENKAKYGRRKNNDKE